MKRTLTLAGWLLIASPAVAQELSEETFQKWYSYLLPRDFEMGWREIPWQPTFLNGVIEAQKKDMPILLWVMNGHPCAET